MNIDAAIAEARERIHAMIDRMCQTQPRPSKWINRSVGQRARRKREREERSNEQRSR